MSTDGLEDKDDPVLGLEGLDNVSLLISIYRKVNQKICAMVELPHYRPRA